MKSLNKLDAPQKRLLIFASLTSLLLIIARWGCLFAVLQPHKWILAANLARWGWGIANLLTILVVVLHLLMLLLWRFSATERRLPIKSTPYHTYLGYILGLLTLGTLLYGRLDISLVSSGLWFSSGALRKLRYGPDETKGETKGFTRFASICTLLSFALLIAALQFRSLPAALWLLTVDIIQWLAAFPGAPERTAIEAMNTRKTKHVPDGTQTNST